MAYRSCARFGAAASSFLLCLLAAINVACGGGTKSSPIQTPVSPNQPTFAHVVLVIEENHSFSEVIGNSAMPYLNAQAQKYGLAAQYFANAHPSLPNYLMLTTGQMETFDDNFSGVINDDHVFRELTNAGKSWKVYAESLPQPAYLGGDVYPYVRRHNPATYFQDIQNNPAQAANIVPFSQFPADLSGKSLPQFSFVVPNVLDDAHDGSLPQADAWLQQNIDPLINNPSFQSSGLLIITFDEGDQTDLENGGGHVATVIISSKSKMNFTSQTTYQHPSALRLILEASGVSAFPGTSAIAPDMTEFFQ
jgi:phosphatidylinositol-3-phosphatase